MKVIILGGFLGSGKTSFLLQLSHYLVERYNLSDRQSKLVIIENEISEIGIDNQLLSNSKFTVKNLFSGCICCTSSEQLEETIELIERTYSPEWLIIEATGLAYPDSIKKTILKKNLFPVKIITLVDAQRWLRLLIAMKEFAKEQLNDADVILLNKIDLEDEISIGKIKVSIRSYNQVSPIIPIQADKLIPNNGWQKIIKLLKD